MRKLIIILTTFFLIISPLNLSKFAIATQEIPTLPGLSCKISPEKQLELQKLNWTDQERWVWKQICEGKEADLNEYIKSKYPKFNNNNFPAETKEIDDLRILTSKFLRTILLYEPFRSSLTERGVIISGAWFQEKLDLYSGIFNQNLSLQKCRFDNSLDLGSIQTKKFISLDGSNIKGGKLYINDAVIGSFLFMRNATFETDIDLVNIKVNSNLEMDGSTFTGNNTSINRGIIGSSLFMKRATFETNIDLVGVKIDNLELEDITIKGFIDMSDAKVNSFKIFGTLTDTNSVYLTNFTYNLLNKNSANFLEDKLREMRYIPQPFEQFAKVAKQIGWHKQAEDVLGNLKDKEIQQKIAEKNLPIALGLIIQRFVIGYGYKIEYSFYWSLVFLFIGFFLAAAKNILVKKVQTTLECWQFLQELKKTAQGVLHFYWIMLLEKRNDPKKYYMIIWESFVYTLDALLPIIELEQKHKDIQVSENIFIKSYFYFLNLWGYLVFALLLPLLF